jgi:hypothetical protein
VGVWVVVLLIVIVLLMCESQEKRGRVLGRVIACGLIGLFVYEVAPIGLALIAGSAGWLWDTGALQIAGRWTWIALEWVMGFAMAASVLLTVYLGLTTLIAYVRRNPKAAFRRAMLVLFGFVGLFATAIAAIFVSIEAIYPTFGEIVVMRNSAMIGAASWLVWFMIRRVRIARDSEPI